METVIPHWQANEERFPVMNGQYELRVLWSKDSETRSEWVKRIYEMYKGHLPSTLGILNACEKDSIENMMKTFQLPYHFLHCFKRITDVKEGEDNTHSLSVPLRVLKETYIDFNNPSEEYAWVLLYPLLSFQDWECDDQGCFTIVNEERISLV